MNIEERKESSHDYYIAHRRKRCEQAAAWQRRHPEKHRKYDAAYRKKSRNHLREYVATHREERREYIRKYRASGGHYEAELAVARALRDGRLIRAPVCMDCGKERLTEAHHHDYSRPLDVVWLCRACHMAVHRRRAQ